MYIKLILFDTQFCVYGEAKLTKLLVFIQMR